MIRLRIASVLLGLTLVAGACGQPSPTVAPVAIPADASPVATLAPAATEGPAASGTPQASAGPSPTAPAMDPAAAFADLVADPFLRATVTIEGTRSAGSTTSAVTGTLDIRGRTSHVVRTTRTGRTSTTSDVIVASGYRYTALNGLWFEDGASEADPLLLAIVSPTPATSTSVETVGGRPLTHLALVAPSVLAEALGATAKGMSGFSGTVDAWVADDGTPVLMRLSGEWDQPSGKKTVHASTSLDLTFTSVGEDVAVDAPDELWTWAKSRKYGYRLAYPVDWQFEKASKKFIDAYWGYDGDAVFGERFKSYGYQLNQLVSIVTDYLEQRAARKLKFTSNKPGKLGAYPARILLYNGQFKKKHYWYVGYVAVKGGWVYWIELRTDKKTKADDKELAAKFASTFRIK